MSRQITDGSEHETNYYWYSWRKHVPEEGERMWEGKTRAFPKSDLSGKALPWALIIKLFSPTFMLDIYDMHYYSIIIYCVLWRENEGNETWKFYRYVTWWTCCHMYVYEARNSEYSVYNATLFCKRHETWGNCRRKQQKKSETIAIQEKQYVGKKSSLLMTKQWLIISSQPLIWKMHF